jgi:two-component system sporulation sensor kinase A
MQFDKNLELLEEIFQEGPVVIFLWKNEPNWPVEFVTNNVVDLTGYTAQEWKEQKVVYSNIIHPEDLERVNQEVRIYSHELKLKRWKHKPYRIIKKTGETIWVRDYTVGIYDKNKNVLRYVGYLLDITEQHLHHLEIEEQLKKYFSFFEHHSANMLIIDPETGKIIDANEAACKFYGYSKNRFKQLHIFDLNTLSSDEIKIQMEQAKTFKKNYFQFPHRLADGSIREVEVYSSAIEINDKKFLFSIIHDITEKVNLEKELHKINRQLEELLQKEIKERVNIYKKYNLLFQQKIFGIGILQEGRIVQCNVQLLKLLGISLADVSQINFFDLIQFSTKEDLLKTIESMDFNKFSFIQEVQLKHNPEKYFLLFIAPFIEKEYKNKIELFVILYDISEKKQIEKENREKEQMLLHQSKLASIGESLSALAHQWRQPLNSLSLMIQFIHQLSELNQLNKENLKEVLDEALQQINFLSHTIDDFRNFFRVDQEKKDFSVKEEIDSLLKILQIQLENHNIKIKISGDDFYVYGFPNLFKHALLNILNNSKDAILDIQKEEKDFAGIISINLDANKHLIKICDNGGGIKEEILQKIFQPYVSTKKVEGTGLGLYLTYIIINKMNANINCYNHTENNQKGACFIIKFRK